MLCNTCGATNTAEFGTRKTKCKKCINEAAKERYRNFTPAQKEEYVRKQREWQGDNKQRVKKWRDDNLMRRRYLGAKHRAERKGLECTITIEDLERLYAEQSGKCFYSGMAMTLKDDAKYAVSVDRINSKKGYTPDNVVLTCYIVNSMKNDLGAKEFFEIVSKLYTHMK